MTNKQQYSMFIGVVIVGLIIAGMLLGVVPKPFNIISSQPVQIQSIKGTGSFLRVTASISPDQKAIAIHFPSKFSINDSAYWKITKPISIFITPLSFYAVTPIGREVSHLNFVYGKGWECLTTEATTTTYKVLNSPYQEMNFKVAVSQAGHIISTKMISIEPRASSTVNIKGINMDFPGWLSRGASPPTKSYVIKDTKVWLRSTFLKDFYNIPFSYPYPSTPYSWQGWLKYHGDCNTNYNAQQIFVTGVINHEGNRWTPPPVALLPFSVQSRAVVGSNVYWYHLLPYSATGLMTITLPKSFIGAEIVQINRIMKVKITHVSGDFKTPYTAGQLKYFYVTVKNSGADGGNVEVTVVSTVFYGSASTYVKAGQVKVLRLPITSRYSPKAISDKVNLVVYGGGVVQDTYSFLLKESKPMSGSINVKPNTLPTSAMRQITISHNKIQFTGNNVYTGNVIGIGIKGIGIETGRGLLHLKFENMHRDLFFPLQHSFTLLPSTTRSEAISYSPILIRLQVTSEETMNVSVNGILVAQNVTAYSYTNPDIYLLLLIPLFFIVALIYIPKRR